MDKHISKQTIKGYIHKCSGVAVSPVSMAQTGASI